MQLTCSVVRASLLVFGLGCSTLFSTCLVPGCGGLFHSPTGALSTPNYPSSYPHNTECVWDINVDSGYIVTLQFNPPFDMENHGTCDYDYVEVILCQFIHYNISNFVFL